MRKYLPLGFFLLLIVSHLAAAQEESKVASHYAGAVKLDVSGLLRGFIRLEGEYAFWPWLSLNGSLSYSNANYDLFDSLLWQETMEARLGPKFYWWIGERFNLSISPHVDALLIYPFMTRVFKLGSTTLWSGHQAWLWGTGIHIGTGFRISDNWIIELDAGASIWHIGLPSVDGGLYLGYIF